MFQRIVCFKYKPETTPEDIAAHFKKFRALTGVIPEIVSYQGGMCFPNADGTPPEYDSAHCLTFRTKDDIAAYFYHPHHQELGKYARAISEKILVVNAEI
jgi:hypothetical protein